MHRLTDEKLQRTKSAMHVMAEGLACSMELPVAPVALGKREDISSIAGCKILDITTEETGSNSFVGYRETFSQGRLLQKQ